jgi:hypothetical protein
MLVYVVMMERYRVGDTRQDSTQSTILLVRLGEVPV